MKDKYQVNIPESERTQSTSVTEERKSVAFRASSLAKRLDRWMIAVLGAALAVCAVFGVLTIKDYIDSGDKRREINNYYAMAENLNEESERLKKVINGSGEDYNNYVDEILRQRGYGPQNEIWYINEEYGN